MLPHFKNLDQETKDLVISKMPESALDLIRMIGLEGTLALVMHYGGQEIPIPRQPNGPNAAGFHEMAERIGRGNLIALGDELAPNELLYIPRCMRAANALRNRQIIAEFDAMIVKKLSCRKACRELAAHYRIAQRTIEKIVNGIERTSRAKNQDRKIK